MRTEDSYGTKRYQRIIASALALGLLIGSGASQPVQATAVQVSGTVVINVLLYPNGTLANGTVTMGAELNIERATAGYDDAPLDFGSASTTVHVVGGKATATLTIPYYFTLNGATSDYRIAISLGASGAPNAAVTFSTSFVRVVAIPANGAKTTIAFTGAV